MWVLCCLIGFTGERVAVVIVEEGENFVFIQNRKRGKLLKDKKDFV